VNIRHPLLRQLVDGSPVGTKSVGELSSRQMQSDAYIYWTPFQEKRLTRYSGHGAAIIAANVAVPMLMIGLLALLVGFWVRHDEPARAKRACTFSGRMALAAVICGVVIYACLPKVQVIASRRPAMQMNHLHQSLIPELYQYAARLRASKGERTKLDAAWVRHQLAENSDFRKSLGTSKQTNLISGQLWREEDSPGNYMIRQTTSGVDYVWYDIDGGENTMTIFDNSDEK
jgi:hypothetical protein